MRLPAIQRVHTGLTLALVLTTLLGLGWDLVRSDEFDTATIPVRDSTEGGVAFVVAVQPAADRMFAAFAAGNDLP